jgi:hypothetical protein
MCSVFELLYTTLLRGIVKYFMHWYYGSSELERLAQARDMPNFLWSLSMSNDDRLTTLHTRLLNSPHLINKDQFIGVAEVKQSRVPERFRDDLSEMHKVFEKVQWMKQDAVAAANAPVSDANPEQISMTDLIWTSLRPYDNTAYYQRDWTLLGFRGSNPFTDLRGAGMLGLLNLLSVSQTELGHRLYALAQTPPRLNYATTSVKVSFMLVKSLYGSALDNCLYRHHGRLQFQRLFDFVFQDLTRQWRQAGLEVLEFDRFAAEYCEGLEEALLRIEV